MMDIEPTASATTAERLSKITTTSSSKHCRCTRTGSLKFVLLVLLCGGFLPVGQSFPSPSHQRSHSSAAGSKGKTTSSLLDTLWKTSSSSLSSTADDADSSEELVGTTNSKKSVSPSWMSFSGSSSSRPSRKMNSQEKEDYIKTLLNYRQLYCQTKFNLQIWPDTTVNGTEKNHQRYAILQIKSEGFAGLVSFKGVATNLYLAMDKNGRLYGSKKQTDDTVFEEAQNSWWKTYYSKNHRNGNKKMYISLNKHGIPREGGKLKGNHKTTQFLTEPVNYFEVDKDLYDFSPLL